MRFDVPRYAAARMPFSLRTPFRILHRLGCSSAVLARMPGASLDDHCPSQGPQILGNSAWCMKMLDRSALD
jgi:hypothetical protein